MVRVSSAAFQHSEVIVVSTLHQFHAQTDAYTFDDLAQLVEKLSPDVLTLELTQADVAERREQGVKQEYQRSIYPLLEGRSYPVVALEPDEPTLYVDFGRRRLRLDSGTLGSGRG